MPRRHLLLAGIIVFASVAVGGFAYLKTHQADGVCTTNPALEQRTVSGNGHSIVAEVASEGVDQNQGLSDRHCLDEDRGMLFVYDLTSDYCFWMKDMRFSIDMLWLDDDKKIVTVVSQVKPDSFPQTFCPDRPAQYVLEINAGQAEAFGWQVGATLDF